MIQQTLMKQSQMGGFKQNTASMMPMQPTMQMNMMGGNRNMMGGNMNMMGGNMNMMSGDMNMMSGNMNMMGGDMNMMGGDMNMMGGDMNMPVTSAEGSSMVGDFL